jgi:hypothetical protein
MYSNFFIKIIAKIILLVSDKELNVQILIFISYKLFLKEFQETNSYLTSIYLRNN